MTSYVGQKNTIIKNNNYSENQHCKQKQEQRHLSLNVLQCCQVLDYNSCL